MGGTSNAKRNRPRRKNGNKNAMESDNMLPTSTPPPNLSNKSNGSSEMTPGSARRSQPQISEDLRDFAGKTSASPYITGDLFQQEVQVRARRERAPMNPVNRLKSRVATMRLRKLLSQEKLVSAPGMPNDVAPLDPSIHQLMPKKQFTVTTKARRVNTFWGKVLCKINPDDFSYAPSGGMVRYINWTFKSSFAIVFLSFVVIFLLLVFIFGLFFKWSGEAEPECIIVSGKDFDYYERGTTMADGFSLSWTT